MSLSVPAETFHKFATIKVDGIDHPLRLEATAYTRVATLEAKPVASMFSDDPPPSLNLLPSPSWVSVESDWHLVLIADERRLLMPEQCDL